MKRLVFVVCAVAVGLGAWRVVASSGYSAPSLKAQGVVIVRALLPCAQAMGKHQRIGLSSVAVLNDDGIRLMNACTPPWRTLTAAHVSQPMQKALREARAAVAAALAVMDDDVGVMDGLLYPSRYPTLQPTLKMLADQRAFLTHATKAFAEVKRVAG